MNYADTEEFMVLNRRFREAFNERIPLMMIPETETFEGLTEKVNKCIKAGKNLLGEIYNWKYDDSEIY